MPENLTPHLEDLEEEDLHEFSQNYCIKMLTVSYFRQLGNSKISALLICGCSCTQSDIYLISSRSHKIQNLGCLTILASAQEAKITIRTSDRTQQFRYLHIPSSQCLIQRCATVTVDLFHVNVCNAKQLLDNSDVTVFGGID